MHVVSSLLCFCVLVFISPLPWGRNRSHGIRGRNSTHAAWCQCTDEHISGRREAGFPEGGTAGFASRPDKLLPHSSTVCHLQSAREGEEMGSDRSTLWVLSMHREGTRRETRKPWGDLQCWRVFLRQEVPSLTLSCLELLHEMPQDTWKC